MRLKSFFIVYCDYLVLGCVKWRQTGWCSPDGPREQHLDKPCTEAITSESGYCECSNGSKAMQKGCKRPYDYGYSYKPTCDSACAKFGMYEIFIL